MVDSFRVYPKGHPSAVPPQFTGPYPGTLYPDHHPGLAVTGSPVAFYSPDSGFLRQLHQTTSVLDTCGGLQPVALLLCQGTDNLLLLAVLLFDYPDYTDYFFDVNNQFMIECMSVSGQRPVQGSVLTARDTTLSNIMRYCNKLHPNNHAPFRMG
jgi:hypothetical protein